VASLGVVGWRLVVVFLGTCRLQSSTNKKAACGGKDGELYSGLSSGSTNQAQATPAWPVTESG
jgi:hypothetical protein